MVHRVRMADIDGSGKWAIVLAPLMGRDSTQKNNWIDGRPVRILAYPIPADPIKGPWVPKTLDENLHVVHNIWPLAGERGKPDLIWCASYEGATVLARDGDHWISRRAGAGNQANPKGSRGASEVKPGRLLNGRQFIATIEPWHGNQVVTYTPDDDKKVWERHVIDDHLRWGHAVWCADLDGDGGDELIVGVRDDLSQKPGERRGVRIYKALDDVGSKWQRHDIDPGGVAVEDLAVGDLGDGRMSIVAVGRQTGNVRIYWNEK